MQHPRTPRACAPTQPQLPNTAPLTQVSPTFLCLSQLQLPHQGVPSAESPRISRLVPTSGSAVLPRHPPCGYVPDKELKVMTIKILTVLNRRVEELGGILTKR